MFLENLDKRGSKLSHTCISLSKHPFFHRPFENKYFIVSNIRVSWKNKEEKKRRNLDTGKRGSKDGDTKRSKGLIFRIVLCRLRSQFRGKLLVLRGRFQLSRRSGATKLQPLNARNSRKSQSSGHRSTVHCWPNTRAGARCEHENTGISISYKTINGGLNRNKNCKSPIAYDVYAVMELPDF